MIDIEVDATLLGGGDSLIYREGKIVSMGYNPGEVVGFSTNEDDADAIYHLLSLQGRDYQLNVKIMEIADYLITWKYT